MIKKVHVKKELKAQSFLRFMTLSQRKQIKNLALNLKGKRVVHVNATAKGGGVAEILQSLIPYSEALGVESDWYAIDEKAPRKFFIITDKIRSGLQGKSIDIKPQEWSLYAGVNKEIASRLERIQCEILVIHDWQPAFAGFYLQRDIPKIFVSHADTSSAFRPVANGILQAMKAYRFTIFSNKDFVDEGLKKNQIKIIAPAIDPLSLKQKIVSQKKAREYLARFGIPRKGQLVLQVSRFDIWKNPMGVLEAFRLIQKEYKYVHLALVGIEEAQDNPDSKRVYQEVKKAVGKDSNISLFFDPKGVPDIPKFTMMAQNAADIIVQNSVKEGFGLTVTEAMWKEKPVIGGPASGIQRQITDKKNGYIANNSQELANRIDYLFSNPDVGKKLGRTAKESVRNNFLMPRLVLDYVNVYNKLIT